MSEGKKYDQDKVRFDLIDPEAELALAKVLTMGARKYDANNWQLVDNPLPRYIGALRRHLNSIERGEYHDSESNLQHAAHIMCNAMFLHYFLNKENSYDPDIQRHADSDSVYNAESEQHHSSSVRLDDAEKARRFDELASEVVKFLSYCGTHLYSGARVIHNPHIPSFTFISSAANETPDGKLHFCLAALCRLSGYADDRTSEAP